MKAVAIQAFGPPEGLTVIDVPDPSPAGGQVLIDTEAIGVGGVDAVIRSGVINSYGFKEGHILGSEVAGTVTAVGNGVDPSWVGQRVWAFTGLGGGYVEQAVAPVEEILPLPLGLSAVDVVTFGSSADITGLLDLDGWPAGMRVIVRKERPHPGAQLRFTDIDGHQFTCFATDAKKGQLAALELRHRRRARCEDRPVREGHRAAEPAAEGLRPEPAVVRDRGAGLRADRLDPDARPGRRGTPE